MMACLWLVLLMVGLGACSRFDNPEPSPPPTPASLPLMEVILDEATLSGRIPLSDLPLQWPVVRLSLGAPRHGTLERDLADSSYRYQVGRTFHMGDTIPVTVDYAPEVAQGTPRGQGQIIVRLPQNGCLPRGTDDEITISTALGDLIVPIDFKANDDTCEGSRYSFPQRMPLGFFWQRDKLYYRHFPRALPRLDTLRYFLCTGDNRVCRTAVIRVRVLATDCGEYLLARPDTLRLRQRETWYSFLQVLGNDRACAGDLSTRSFRIVRQQGMLTINVDYNLLAFKVQLPTYLDTNQLPQPGYLWFDYEIRSESSQVIRRARVTVLPP